MASIFMRKTEYNFPVIVGRIGRKLLAFAVGGFWILLAKATEAG